MPVPTLYDNADEDNDAVLELCHYSLKHFPKLDTYASTLRSLVIIAQDIKVVGDLSECKVLENLWICETGISDITGLSCCSTLRNLHLYSNAIEDVQGLENLELLENLWLNDNVITSITPIFHLPNLKVLNLANNRLLDISASISNLSSLITLNLAGNLLCSIDTLKNLGGLPSLEHIVLENPFYGSNPICLLHNYELLLLCYCDTLTQLNEKSIHNDIVQQANEILYQKTKHFETIWQTRVSHYLKQVMLTNESIAKMSSSLSYLVSYLDWTDISQQPVPPQHATALYHHHLKRIKTMHRQINELYNQLVLEHSKLKISFFYLGNVDFQDTLPEGNQSWLAKLPDLHAHTKWLFIAYPFPYPDSPLEIVTLNEDIQLIISSKLPCAFSIKHFGPYSESPSVPQFVSTEYSEYKNERSASLHACLLETQTSHLVSLDLVHMELTSFPSTTCLPCVTCANLSFNLFSDLNGVFRALPQIQTLKIAYNQISILPSSWPPNFQSIDLSGNLLSPHSYGILQKWDQALREVIYDDYLVQSPIQLFKDYFLFTDVTNLVLDDIQLQQVEVLATFCHVQMLSLRNNQLESVDGLVQLVHLEKLFLGGNALTNIDPLSALHNLQVLDCTCNRVKTLSPTGPRSFPKLVHLNLNANQLTSLEAFKHFPALQELYLAYNHIHDPKELNYLSHLPLLVLDLTDNLLRFAYYRPYMIYCIPMLQFLDGVTVDDEEMANAKSLLVGCLTREKLLECMHLQRIPMLTCLDLRGCQLVKIDCFRSGEFNALAFVNLDHNQFTEVHNLSHLHGLRCLSLNGNKLDSLPEANVGDPALWPYLSELYLDQNHVSKLIDLHLSCTSDLRLLSLRGNRISRLDGIEQIQSVQKLYLDQNQIRHFDPDAASMLRCLKELSLNDNRLKNIRFLRFLPKLKYFHGDRNRINSLTDLTSHSLQGISLLGNPVARHLHYRMHLIHCLVTISRIDGVIVNEEERQNAKNTEAIRWQVTAPLVTTVTKQALRFSNVTLDGSELDRTNKRHYSSNFNLNYR